MAQKLTPISVGNAKAKSARREIADGGCAGLYLVVQVSGSKSWCIRYRYNGAPKKLTLGPLLVGGDEPKNPAIGLPTTLAGARKLAVSELHKLKQGIDPAAHLKNEKATTFDRAAARQRDSVDAVARQFLDLYAKKHTKSWRETAQLLGLKPDPENPNQWVKTGKGILETWSGRSIHEITRRNVIALLDAMVERGVEIMANRTLAAIRKMFNWALSRDIISASPCAGVAPPGNEKPRERILSDDEICVLWRACGDSKDDGKGGIGEPYGSFVRVLALTGQRLREVGGMRWSEIVETDWTIPGSRTKNGSTHIVPLAEQALAIIKAAPRIAGSDFVFSTTGDGPLNGFGRAKERLDERMKPGEAWQFHDLRRSAASGMQGLGFSVEVIERALNHKSGAFKGVAGVYQRNPLADEKRQALQAWADHVEQLVSGKPAKVLRPKFGRRR